MSNLSKIVILILLIMSFFYIKAKVDFDKIHLSVPDFKKTEVKENNKPENSEQVNQIIEQIENINPIGKNEEKEFVWVYFLALDSHDNSIYKRVKREIPEGKDKLEFAISELLKGPNLIEKAAGTYSEIPQNTKLIKIENKGNKIIIEFSSDFEIGGGTDSIYSRMMQLIKTAITNTENKKIYLYINGKQVNFLGGEGVMITQPLNEKSLEV